VNVVLGVWGSAASWQSESQLADIPNDEPSLDALEPRAVERSLTLLALRHRVESDRGRVAIAQTMGWLPLLEAGVAAAQHEGIVYSGPAIRVALPLGYQGQGVVGLREAELRRDQAELIAEGVRVRALVRSARETLVFARDRARFVRDVQLPLRRSIVEQAQRQFNAMQLNAFQLLRAQSDAVDAQRSYVEALRDYWIARAEMARILGGGSTRRYATTDDPRDERMRDTTEGAR
jgi:cobalt-zinc-cadmium efflux system outer membrane protein